MVPDLCARGWSFYK